ncbi:hypothetical protein M378DRAFT_161801 [Amanita muscaria Koide BX008]|uniref:Uncharacterized protein n=1 Tax=Amanita muscaria (strain Koide BX008) TaxID=946122 RepID=A0A0C2TFY7_AMAMK|nr:hypothetical protein M378DRAFT_161801 [Amanita muscaria Koide BX008]
MQDEPAGREERKRRVEECSRVSDCQGYPAGLLKTTRTHTRPYRSFHEYVYE